MKATTTGAGRMRILLRLFAAAAGLMLAHPAMADYLGPSYLKVPGVNGGAVHGKYRKWLRAEGNYWGERPPPRDIRGVSGKDSGLKFTGSRAPAQGASVLALAIDKHDPGLGRVMQLCRSGAALPELVYAESADLARHSQEHGPRPADVPGFYEYALKDVTLSCPVAEGAPEQAIAVRFKSIEWLNSKPQPRPRVITAAPARLIPAARKGASRVFVISWMAPISDASPDQCAAMNPKPTQDDYYALMSPERAAAQRAALASKGGANTAILPYRGPGEMNVTLLPGIVPDPGFVEPTATVVRGFDLDGNDGTGPVSGGRRPHRNFVAPDGRRGIDNQLFVIQGCVAGWRRNGFLPMIGNELRRAGGLSILVEISGIPEDGKDGDVTVSILYSADPIKRDGTSKIVLPDFTYRVNPNPEFSQDFVRFRGRYAKGVIFTDPVAKVTMHEGSASTWTITQARMRLELTPQGGLKGEIGGYRDWREYVASAFFRNSDYENTIGYNTPAMYNAVRRAADGVKDPETGEFTAISAAYEIEGVPAFIPPEQQAQLATRGLLAPVSNKLAAASR